MIVKRRCRRSGGEEFAWFARGGRDCHHGSRRRGGCLAIGGECDWSLLPKFRPSIDTPLYPPTRILITWECESSIRLDTPRVFPAAVYMSCSSWRGLGRMPGGSRQSRGEVACFRSSRGKAWREGRKGLLLLLPLPLLSWSPSLLPWLFAFPCLAIASEVSKVW